MTLDRLWQLDATNATSNSNFAGANIAENCAMANLNNAIRSVMVGVKEALDVLGGGKTTAGSSGTYTLTSGMSLSAYAAG